MYKYIDWDSKHINKLELKKAIKNDLKNTKKDDLTDLIALLITEDICVGEKENMYNGYMKQYAKNRNRVSDNIKKSIKSVPTIVIYNNNKPVARFEAGLTMRISVSLDSIQAIINKYKR